MSSPSFAAAVDLYSQIAAAHEFLRQRTQTRPQVGIILGTGLGGFAREIAASHSFTYDDIPHFPRATALGHKGQLTFGTVAGLPVVAMEGRFHLYEGYPAATITLPVRVMHRLGIELLIVSNASGGLNPHYQVGDLVVIDDHINLMFDNPLIGPGDPALGSRRPDMSRPYDPSLIAQTLAIARQQNIAAHRGVYVGVTGPNYESRAEYRFFRRIGADVIGMSTVPEVITAAQLGLKVLALSTVTNVCRPDALATTDGAEVAAAAAAAEPRLRVAVRTLLANLAPVGIQP
jgi:purine-nucleoside phosphorylase